MKKGIVDGCQAVARVAYKLSQVIPVYPITPSSPMAEYCTTASSKGEKNLFGEKVSTIEMQSESGVAGAMHGALLSGALSTTFTSSQGLLLMLPNMFKIVGEHLPNVIHVSSRAVASHALNIFCDHSDVMAVREAGYTMLCSSSVQEAQDLALASHLLALSTSSPVLHFMDGFRTSHELQKIDLLEETDLKKFVKKSDILKSEFVKNRLTCANPLQYGTAQNPDTFFQNKVASKLNENVILDNLKVVFSKIQNATGKSYAPYMFYGNKDAKYMIVAMGSACETIREFLESNNISDVCLCSVKLFRPFMLNLPQSVQKICVLDRCQENLHISPLAQDVIYRASQSKRKIEIIKGIYGLGGKDFSPKDVCAVVDNLKSNTSKDNFTVGIIDDQNNSSITSNFSYEVDDNFEIKIFGLGSDGSVSASKSIVKILGDHHNKYVQGYFEYDSRKSGSMTISHIRISDKPIHSAYLLEKANVIMINNFSFVHRYDCLKGLKKGGTVIFNSIFNEKEIGKILPKSYTEKLKQLNAKVFCINGNDIAQECELNEKINIIMMAALFKATTLLPINKASADIEEEIKNTFARKGQKVIEKNLLALQKAIKSLKLVDNATLIGKKDSIANFGKSPNSQFVQNVQKQIANLNGNNIPVSQFSANGAVPTNTTQYEKRGIAEFLPKWIKENCIQCGQCVLACPHSALRAILLDEKQASSPEEFAKAIGIKGALYKIQVSPLDCTGCRVCAHTCPAIKKALQMVGTQEIIEKEKTNYIKFSSLPQLEQNVFSDDHAKGLQFKKSYFEFSGACAGCGETPYIKLASMLFGENMVIANATGCSSIYGGTFASCPYVKDKNGKGPAWANSLFEDNAEFGLGIKLAKKYDPLKNAEKESVWIIGGDGWAYDIGFGGLDHVLASGEDVNILVLDNESYSNTGGQSSKATPMGANVKLAENSKRTHKKNLGQIAMTYPNVYVAQVALGANMSQCIKAFKEANAHNGPSLIIAYSPCINMGFNLADMISEQKAAVECGYWQLYRFDGNKLSVDSQIAPEKYMDFLAKERRYEISLANEQTKQLLEENKLNAVKNYNKLNNFDKK